MRSGSEGEEEEGEGGVSQRRDSAAAAASPSSPTSLRRSPMQRRGPPIPLIFSDSQIDLSMAYACLLILMGNTT